MNIQDILNQTNNVKNVHIIWFANIKAFSISTDLGNSSVLKKYTEYSFGKRYYFQLEVNK